MKLLSEFNKPYKANFVSLPFFTREAHMRTTKSGKRVPVKKSKVKNTDSKNNISKLLVGNIFAASLGIGGFMALRKRTIKKLKDSAKVVKTMADNLDIEDVLKGNSSKRIKKNSAVFTISGLQKKDNPNIINFIKGQGKHKGAIIHNSVDSMELKGSSPASYIKTLVGNQIKLGYNPVARETAARAFTFHKKFPDKNIIFTGHSWGGTTANEASLILKELGVPDKNIKVMTLGSDSYRLLPKSKVDRLDIVDKLDNKQVLMPFAKSMKDKRAETSQKAHFLHTYINNYKKEIQEKLKEWS